MVIRIGVLLSPLLLRLGFQLTIYLLSLNKNFSTKMKKLLITLPAHFDGKSIILDAPFELQPHDKLLVTILKSESDSDERKDWIDSSLSQLNRAYTDDEPEYSVSMIKEPNPEYKK